MQGDKQHFLRTLPASLVGLTLFYFSLPLVLLAQRHLLADLTQIQLALYVAVYAVLPMINVTLVYWRSLWFLPAFIAHTSLLFLLVSQMLGLWHKTENGIGLIAPESLVPWLVPLIFGAAAASIFGGLMVWVQDLLPPFLSAQDRYWRRALRTAGNKPLTIEAKDSRVKLITEDASRTGLKLFGDTKLIEPLKLERGAEITLSYNAGDDQQFIPVRVRWVEDFGPFIRFGVSFDEARGHSRVLRLVRGVADGQVFNRSSKFWAVNGSRYAAVALWLVILGGTSGMPACGENMSGPESQQDKPSIEMKDPSYGFQLAPSEYSIVGTISGCEEASEQTVTLPSSNLQLSSTATGCRFDPGEINQGEERYLLISPLEDRGNLRFRNRDGAELTLKILSELPSPIGDHPEFRAHILQAETLALMAVTGTRVPLPTVSIRITGDLKISESEAGPRTATVELLVDDPPLADLTINLATQGQATPGLDFVLDSVEPESATTMVRIAAGSTTTEHIIEIIDDGEVEGTEAVVVNILPDASYELGSETSAGFIIEDDDATFPNSGLVFALDSSSGVDQTNGVISAWNSHGTAITHSASASGSQQPILIEDASSGVELVEFDGVDDLLDVANHADFNDATVYSAKTLMVIFHTGTDVDRRQVIFEQGGQTRGFNLYIDQGKVYINAYNLARDGNPGEWGPFWSAAAIEPNSSYAATLVIDGAAETTSTYFNAQPLDTFTDSYDLYRHTGTIGLGGVSGDTYFHDGGTSSTHNFAGSVSHLWMWNSALSASEVLSTYQLSWQSSQSETPILSVSADSNEVYEDSDSFQLIISSDRPSPQDITVHLAAAGTASSSDWSGLPAIVTLPAFATRTELQVAILNDNEEEAPESIILKLNEGTGYHRARSEFALTLIDDDSFYPIGDVVGWWPDPPQSPGESADSWSAGATELAQNNSSQQPTAVQLSADDPRVCLAFDGSNDVMTIANSSDTNDGGPYDEKFVSIEFRSGATVSGRQMLFEEGGTVRGFNIYIADGQIYGGAWNLANDDGTPLTPWGGFYFNAPIAANQIYRVSLAYSARQNSIEFYVNNQMVGQQSGGVGRLYRHTGGIGLGAINNDTYYHDGTARSGDHFNGCVLNMIYQNNVPSKPTINLLHL